MRDVDVSLQVVSVEEEFRAKLAGVGETFVLLCHVSVQMLRGKRDGGKDCQTKYVKFVNR